jgi:hypothetical protein
MKSNEKSRQCVPGHSVLHVYDWMCSRTFCPAHVLHLHVDIEVVRKEKGLASEPLRYYVCCDDFGHRKPISLLILFWIESRSERDSPDLKAALLE